MLNITYITLAVRATIKTDKIAIDAYSENLPDTLLATFGATVEAKAIITTYPSM